MSGAAISVIGHAGNARPTGDYGGFRSMAQRLRGEEARRLKNAGRALLFHNALLDDTLQAILPNDLVVIGAFPGMGKTAFALQIAATNAMLKKRVHYFALEAEPDELERRTKFAQLSMRAHRDRREGVGRLSYTSWMLGKCSAIVDDYNAEVDALICEQLATLYTFYRGAHFDYENLQRQVLDIADSTDLIVIDHLHYVDPREDASEASTIADTVKAIRDIALRVGKPVILVAHLRKPERGKSASIMPGLFDFHGSSEIGKVATQAVLFDRAWSVEPSKWYLAPTFMTVPKDRRDGDTGLVALCQFDKRTRAYQPHYALGKIVHEKGSQTWKPIAAHEAPGWALHHKALEVAA